MRHRSFGGKDEEHRGDLPLFSIWLTEALMPPPFCTARLVCAHFRSSGYFAFWKGCHHVIPSLIHRVAHSLIHRHSFLHVLISSRLFSLILSSIKSFLPSLHLLTYSTSLLHEYNTSFLHFSRTPFLPSLTYKVY